jgi:hypothetical protein
MFGNDEIWKQRLESLCGLIDNTEKAWPSGVSDEKLLRALFDRLQFFYAGQMEYFFTHPAPNPQQFTNEFAFQHTGQQAALDLEILERAAHQRAWGPLALQEALRRTDHFMRLALLPAQAWFPEEITTLTYFSPQLQVRVLPYAPVALIGLPYTAANLHAPQTDWRDLLMILNAAGEVALKRGHAAQAGHASFQELLQWRLPPHAPGWHINWAQAAFAAVYACQLGGPLAALYAQDLALALPNAAITQTTFKQPAPITTIRFYTRTLERLGLADWAASLQARWSRQFGERGVRPVIKLPAPVTEVEAYRPCDDGVLLADLAYNLMLKIEAPAWHAMYSETPAYPPTQLEHLYSNVARHLAEWPLTQPAPLFDFQEATYARHLTHSWPEAFVAHSRALRRSAPALPTTNPAELDWLAVLNANGWGEVIS